MRSMVTGWIAAVPPTSTPDTTRCSTLGSGAAMPCAGTSACAGVGAAVSALRSCTGATATTAGSVSLTLEPQAAKLAASKIPVATPTQRRARWVRGVNACTARVGSTVVGTVFSMANPCEEVKGRRMKQRKQTTKCCEATEKRAPARRQHRLASAQDQSEVKARKVPTRARGCHPARRPNGF